MIAEETSRLRRLDALFAEKVLGCKILKDDSGDFVCGCADAIDFPHGSKDGDGAPIWPEIRAYTRSLDAAWEGMQQLHLDYSENRKIWDDTGDGSKPYGALIEGAKGKGFAKADHPAEALVLACLRAVGVSEEELK